jgi:hypothetical protein
MATVLYRALGHAVPVNYDQRLTVTSCRRSRRTESGDPVHAQLILQGVNRSTASLFHLSRPVSRTPGAVFGARVVTNTSEAH